MAWESIEIESELQSGDVVRIKHVTRYMWTVADKWPTVEDLKTEFLNYFENWKHDAFLGPIQYHDDTIQVLKINDPSFDYYSTKGVRAKWTYEAKVLCPITVEGIIGIILAIAAILEAIYMLSQIGNDPSNPAVVSWASKQTPNGQPNGGGDGQENGGLFDLEGVKEYLPLIVVGLVVLLIIMR